MLSAVEEQISNLNVTGGVGAHVLLCRWDCGVLALCRHSQAQHPCPALGAFALQGAGATHGSCCTLVAWQLTCGNLS